MISKTWCPLCHQPVGIKTYTIADYTLPLGPEDRILCQIKGEEKSYTAEILSDGSLYIDLTSLDPAIKAIKVTIDQVRRI